MIGKERDKEYTRVEDENCNITPFVQSNSKFDKQTSFRPKTRGWKMTEMGKDAQKDSHP